MDKLKIDADKTKKRLPRNEREVWNNYMANKQAKLDHQFATDGEHVAVASVSKIFEGVRIYVNGYTDPPSDVLKRLMKIHGGIYQNYNTASTTHVIASNLPNSKIRVIKDKKIIKPEWITESIAAGKLLDHKSYLLYSSHAASQQELQFNRTSASNCQLPDAESSNEVGRVWTEGGQTSAQSSSACGSSRKRTRNKDESTDVAATNVKDDRRDVVGMSSVERDEFGFRTPVIECDAKIPKISTTNAETTILCRTTNDGAGQSFPKTGDSNFLSEFYNHSRLHYISTAQLELRELVLRLREESDGTFPARRKLAGGSASASLNHSKAIIMHIDMDCFFVSVGLRHRPDLKGQPVAVSHASESSHAKDNSKTSSMSDIASCNYEARKFGVKNGMLLGKALKRCPNLVTIPYDFKAYKEVGENLYKIVAAYTLDIEAVSCDELVVDCTSVLKEVGSTPEELAKCIREDVKKETDCCCSIGIGKNFLMAKLATRTAKPDGLFHISTEQQEQNFLATEDVRNLPGIGRVMEEQLAAIDVKTCGDLQTISESALKKLFGPTKGLNLYKLCRGIDERKIEINRQRQSVSSEINYAIRFEEYADFPPFITKLAVEVRQRLLKADAKGKQITLKLKIKQPDAPVKTAKFMGHGLVDNLTRSVTLRSHTNDSDVIAVECETLLQQMKVNVKDIRGVGIQMTKLNLENNNRDSSASSIKSYLNKNANTTAVALPPGKTSNAPMIETPVHLKLHAASKSSEELLEPLKVRTSENCPSTEWQAAKQSKRPASVKTKPSPKKNISPLKDAPYKFTAINSYFNNGKMKSTVNEVVAAAGVSKSKTDEIRNEADVVSDTEMRLEEEERPADRDRNNGEDLPFSAFKKLIKDWTALNEEPLQEDIDMVQRWIGEAVLGVRLMEAFLIIKYFLRLIENKKEIGWGKVAEQVVGEAQRLVNMKYGGRLDIAIP